MTEAHVGTDRDDSCALTDFEASVLAVVGSLGSGEIVTYGEVAAEVGKPGAARAVGSVLRRHGSGVPWWRVVAANGRLVPGGEQRHTERLRSEGVAIRDGRVVMGCHEVDRQRYSRAIVNVPNHQPMTVTFADLGLSQPIVDALYKRGIKKPFPIQAMSIPDAITGRDVCGKAQTGSGKTFAFGLPVLQQLGIAEPKRPLALALVPTRELAVQVHGELAPIAKALDRTVTAIYGGADIEKQIEKLTRGVDFVVATPGRLIDLIERREVQLDDVVHVIVDEADRMADMGFMPQVEWLLRHIPGHHQTLLFSATLDGVVDKLVSRYQTDPARFEVTTETTTVDSMSHRFLLVHEMDRAKVVAAIAAAANRTLVFCRTKHGADRLTASINDCGVSAAAIHGDLRQKSRERALADFANGDLEVLVATDVAARGIHVDDVDVVIHLQPAADHKSYLHRSGRTARAGRSGVAVTLSLWNEELEVKRLQKRLGLDEPIVEVFSNDERLADLDGLGRADG